MKYIYKIVLVGKGKDSEKELDMLNKMGKDGWRLVTILIGGISFYDYYFVKEEIRNEKRNS